MKHQEYMESIGQTSIFDFLEITPTSKRNKAFTNGDKVIIRYYQDEIDYVMYNYPQLMQLLTVVGKIYDFYQLELEDGSIVEVPGEKLKLVEASK